MPISVTCQCGARLEIDEKFLGKAIPCPDCNRPLPTTPPATPPPLEMPDHRRVSGLAVLSLVLATVGAFTIVGTLAAIAVGLLALREIARRPTKLEGAGLARAGILTGTVMTFICLVALVSPYVFGIDSFLREFKYVGRWQFPKDPKEQKIEVAGLNNTIIVKRPDGRWGVFVSTNQDPNVATDDLLLLNARDDAYVACQHEFVGGGDNADDRKKKALDRFKKSELVHLLNGGPLVREWKEIELKDPPPDKTQEVMLDVRLGSVERRVLLQLSTAQNRLDIIIAVTRRSDFERLETDIRKIFESRIIQ